MNPLVDLKRLAESGQPLTGQWPLARFERLWTGSAQGLPGAEPWPDVSWQVQAEWRRTPAADAGLGEQPRLWLHLQAEARVPVVCQRCLEPFGEQVMVDRWFRFAPDEATAAAEDEDSEEDVLVWAPRLNLLDLLEDELLLGLSLVPLHTVCPEPLPLPREEADADSAVTTPTPHPFAGLAVLKKACSS